MLERRRSPRPCHLVVMACFLLISCTSPDAAPAVTPSAVGTPASALPTATPRMSPICDRTGIPNFDGIRTPDPWAHTRAALPADVAVYRPAALPDRFGEGQVLEACVDQGTPNYTVIYASPDESVVFVLNSGYASWGNTPGPLTSTRPIIVNGVDGMYSEVTNLGAGTPVGARFMGVTWGKAGRSYAIKVTSARLTEEDVRQIAANLVRVP